MTTQLTHVDFNLDESFPAVKLLDSLIENQRESIKDGTWNKTFIISETVNKFTVCGTCVTVDGLLDIAKIVSYLMLQFGLATSEVNDDNVNIEFHYAKFQKDSQKHHHPDFDVHCDDYGGTSYPVHTFIIYRSVNLVEGNFGFYDDMYGKQSQNPTEIVNIQDVSVGHVKAIIFDGAIHHNAMPIVEGERYALSFQIKKL